MVLIFILIYFEWRDTENQQLGSKQKKSLKALRLSGDGLNVEVEL